MFNKIYPYIFILIAFAIFVSRSSGDYGYEAYPIQQCSENTSYFGYCIDCETELDCNNGADGDTHECNQDQACQVSSFYAACTPKSRYPECSCPVGQYIQKPDPYDETKYLVCNDGDRYIFQCPENEVYFPDTEECNTPLTTTTTTTTTSGCPATEIVKKKVNCTCYRFCFGESNTYRDECCDPGEIYMEDTEKCVFYYPFSCSGKTDGRYVDTQNCSVYHICVSNSTFATINCNDGEVFDEATESCTTDATCNALVDCGICPDDKTFIKIDCYNFYECRKNTDSDYPPYVPVADTCPEGTCFDDITTFCELG